MEIIFKGKKRGYKLESDGRQFVLSEVRIAKAGKLAGEKIFYPIAYFSKIENVLDSVMNLEIFDSEAKSFTELFGIIRETKELVYRLISEQTEPSVKAV